MGMFDWLRQLFQPPEEGLIRRYEGAGICPYCGEPLRAATAQQCFECGADWHDAEHVVRHRRSRRFESVEATRQHEPPPRQEPAQSPESSRSQVPPARPVEQFTAPRPVVVEDPTAPVEPIVFELEPPSGDSGQPLADTPVAESADVAPTIEVEPPSTPEPSPPVDDESPAAVEQAPVADEGPPVAEEPTTIPIPVAPAPAPTPLAKREPGDLSHLDAGQFTPLDDDSVREQAGQLGSLWGNPWFGRRDVIPPTTDARTLLIDHAMVAHGFITPEELSEIHEVGEQMDEVRPDVAVARQLAESAVVRTLEDREQIKQQKKAEAEQRRKQHAEAVEQRRQTDIVFLGRGVSGGLHDRQSDADKLRQSGLPLLATPAEVAEALGTGIPRLRWLAFHNEAATRTHYVRFQVPKKSGGTRELAAPHRSLARCQQWILRNVLDKLPQHDAAHGFVRGRSTVTGATVHAGSEVVMNLDLQDFFPTISFRRVRGAFRQLGYSPAVATIFALLCTESPRETVQYDGTTYHVATGQRRLPQGACTSPGISNLVSRRMDSRLNGISDKLGWQYTRYADDLTFSASGEAVKLAAYLMARIRHISQDEGFRVNEKKTRLQSRNRAQSVTGIVVNQRPGVPRKTVRRLRAILHRAKTEGLASQNRDDHPNFEGWVRGMVAYIAMVNPNQAKPLREALDSLVG